MWVLPSYGRPVQCASAVAAMIEHGSTAHGAIYVCSDDPSWPEYVGMTLPPQWQVVTMPEGMGWQPDKLNNALRRFPDEPWYGWIADDIFAQTHGFEDALVRAAGSWGIASGNDLWQAKADIRKGRMHGATVFGGDFLRAWGQWVPPGFKHWYIEDVWESLGRELGNWRTLMDVVTEHRHPFKDGAEGDETHSRANEDGVRRLGEMAYHEWRSSSFASDVFRLRQSMWAARGLNLNMLHGRSVMFGLPCYDKVDPKREEALMNAVYLLAQFGVRVGHLHVTGQTIHIARNAIADAFMRSDFTDLFFIDADMSFSAWDVVKFIAAPHPLLAGVGRKRAEMSLTDPATWCFHLDPKLKGVMPKDEYGMCEVAQVGTGLMRIRREVFEAILANDNSLLRAKDRERKNFYAKYFAWTDDGEDEISEDITFCRRYTDAGGKIWIDPHVGLYHYGQHGWYGCVRDIME